MPPYIRREIVLNDMYGIFFMNHLLNLVKDCFSFVHGKINNTFIIIGYK
jgi:hypothetical protein